MTTIQNPYTPELWPGGSVPVPNTWRGTVVADGDGWYTLPVNLSDGYNPTLGPPPMEAHLRELLSTDPGDVDSLLSLVEAVGVPVMESAPWLGYVSPQYSSNLNVYWSQVERSARDYGLELPQDLRLEEFGAGARHYSAFHITEASNMVQRLQLLVRHVIAVGTSAPVETVWAGSQQSDDPPAWDHGGNVVADAPASLAAWHWFQKSMEESLFPAHLGFRTDPLAPYATSHPSDAVPAVTALAVMIFNDLSERAPIKFCAYEKCRRPFHRQRGGGTGQFSKSEGVIYCTPQHARTQSQLERRRSARSGGPRG